MKAVGFVTCARWPDVSASDQLAADALARLGVRVEARPWNAPDARLDGLDLVVLRSCWDYHFALDAFLDWLARVEAGAAPVWNPPALVRWNLDKRYLLDLAGRGLPVVPTVALDGGAALPAVMAERGWATAVLKPAVSASGHDTVLVGPADAAAVGRALDAGRIRGPALVQPFVEAIRTEGEWSLVFVDGAFTHAVLKHPGPGDFRVQRQFGGVTVAATPPGPVIDAARQAVETLAVPPLYARVDGVVTNHRFILMELELAEPGLFFDLAPPAAERFAEAVARRL